MLRALIRVSAETERIPLPFLAMQGGEDHLVDPDGAQIRYERAGSKDKTLKIYPGLYHEIFNEPEREIVFREIADWLGTLQWWVRLRHPALPSGWPGQGL